MTTRLQLPRILKKYSAGKTELKTTCRSVDEMLGYLQTNYPNLYNSVCDETGRLRQHINLFVNNQLLTERVNFETQLNDGDVVAIFQSVSGG